MAVAAQPLTSDVTATVERGRDGTTATKATTKSTSTLGDIQLGFDAVMGVHYAVIVMTVISLLQFFSVLW